MDEERETINVCPTEEDKLLIESQDSNDPEDVAEVVTDGLSE